MAAFRARYIGTCASCGGRIELGDYITWTRKGGRRTYHARCKPGRSRIADAPAPATEAPAKVEAPNTDAEDTLDLLADALSKRMALEAPALDENKVRAIAQQEANAVAERFAKTAPLLIDVKRPDGTIHRVEGLHHHLFPKLLYLVGKRHNAYLYGPSQSGKSYAAAQVARTLDLPYYYLSLNPQTPDSRLVGFVRPDGTYQGTVFYKAYAEGGVCCLDETDNASAGLLTTLNSALANGAASFPCGMVERHADCVIVATGNTPGRGGTALYPERRPLDGAFAERFTFLHWEYDETLEEALVTGINPKNGATLLAWVRNVREYAASAGLRLMATPTVAMRLAEYALDTALPTEQAADAVVFKGIDAATRSQVLQRYKLPTVRP